MIIKLPGGNQRSYDSEKSLFEIANDISPSLKKRSIVARLDDKLVDMNTFVNQDSSVEFITDSDSEALEVLRHSTAHLLAEAVKKIYPQAKFGVNWERDEEDCLTKQLDRKRSSI